MTVPIDDAYFVWLYSQVGEVDVRNLKKTYWKLLRLLYTREFTWSDIERDANRAQDGKDLRKQFLEETGTPTTKKELEETGQQYKELIREPAFLDVGCSVLEMLVALAWAVAFEGGGTQSERFWEMIDNLELLEFNDANPPPEDVVNHIIDRVINREYLSNGLGGLFPINDMRNQQDQRHVELWYQANAYLLERI